MFFSSFEHDAALEEVDWRDWIATPTQCVFGLFDGETLVGITAAYTHRDDPDGHTALLGTSYVQPAYRGRGLARLLYETRLAWIRARGTFHRVVVSHRRSNEPSRRAIERCGFELTGNQSRTWPDGAVEDELLYQLDLTAHGAPR
jgi:RimJ/RimL family protein N-acetyltransferase